MNRNVRCPRTPGRLGRLALLVALLFSAAAQASLPGAPLGPELSVNEAGAAARQYPAVARNAGGDTVVAWVVDGGASRETPVPSEIRARRLAADGTPLGPELRVGTVTAPAGSTEEGLKLFSNRPAVGIDATGAFVVAWTDSGAPNTVRARRYGSDGSPLGAPVEVASNTGFTLAATVAMNEGGDFVVAWSEYQYRSLEPACQFRCTVVERGGFRARRYTGGGTVASRTIVVADHTIIFEADLAQPLSTVILGPVRASFSTAVGMANDGSFALAWSRYGAVGLSSGVFTRRYDAHGRPGPTLTVTGPEHTVSRELSLAMNPAGSRYVVAYIGGAESVLQARSYYNGLPEGPAFQVNGSRLFDDALSSRPAVSMSAGGDFVVAFTLQAFQGAPSTPTQIAVQRYASGGGALGGNQVVAAGSDPAVASDAAGNFVVVWNSADGQAPVIDGESSIEARPYAGP